MENHGAIDYNDALEKLLVKEAERALCLRWAHSHAQSFNATWNTRLAIPTIVLSTLAGSAGLAGEGLLPFRGATTMIGMITLFCSIMNTVSAYYAFSKKAESHRVAALAYGRVHRTIEMELAMARKQRMPAGKLLEMLREETERLSEIVPMIDDAVVAVFKERFHSDSITKPPELNGLERVSVVASETNLVIRVDEPEVVSPSRRSPQKSAF